MQIKPSPDIDDTRALLEAAGLPVADLSLDLLKHFLGAAVDGQLLGAVGYEPYGRMGLLRSLVVAPTGQGVGLGARLVSAIETQARDGGVDRLYLLTTDADRYFERHGYVRVERESVPAEIRATAQYSTLCPGSAVVMQKTLARD